MSTIPKRLFVPREDWGADKPRSRTRVPDNARTLFVVHYTTGEELAPEDRSRVDEWLRGIQAFHMGKGWADIGYNFLIGAGRIWEGRGWGYAGAHADGFNTKGWGVAFLGDNDPGRDVPPEDRALFRLLYEVGVSRAGHGIRPVGHRDVNPDTVCPGGELAKFVASNLTLGVPGKGPKPRHRAGRPVPGPTGRGAPPFPLPDGRFYGNGKGGVDAGRDLARWQRQMADRGWPIADDGVYGPQTEAVARAFQREKGLGVDGRIGRRTWAAAWQARIT